MSPDSRIKQRWRSTFEGVVAAFNNGAQNAQKIYVVWGGIPDLRRFMLLRKNAGD